MASRTRREQQPDWNGELNPGPLEIGFDHCFLLPTTNDRVPQVYVQDHRVLNLDPADPLWVGDSKPSDRSSHRDHASRHAQNGLVARSQFDDSQRDQPNRFLHRRPRGPLSRRRPGRQVGRASRSNGSRRTKIIRSFCSLPRTICTCRGWSTSDFKGKTSLGPRGDAIVELDWCVGQLLETLDRLKLAENTLVVFCSDNGPVLDDGYKDDAIEKIGDHKPAGPYRGGKYNVFEGGTRTPFITRWIGRIPPGESDEMVCTIDLAASCAALAGVELPDDGVPRQLQRARRDAGGQERQRARSLGSAR